ncbi:hypothetical protein B0H17DRAFT_1149275 [Mycena rosella]|uniref:Uncharacterized protein n=1 Tax=Mycena rosella TaxID=1033263 RepID=A0AAD7FQK7_MYCRO|nr:hypothetical protein B0H17DRAFT_1149275 [Mycena rosella]
MCNLAPRFSCQNCPPSARCAAFVGSDIDPRTRAVIPRMNATSSAEICKGCNHPWICHEALGCDDNTHPNFHFRKGGYPPNVCGGFHSEATNWDYLTRCICLAQWMSHLPLGMAQGTLNVLPTSLLPAPAAVIPQMPSLPFSAPPISAFVGPAPVVRGNVGTHRIASAEQTLPQHSGNSPSVPAPRRGPRNSYPSASTSRPALAPARGASAAGPFSTDAEVLVAVYPLVESGVHEIPGHPTIPFAVHNENLLDYVNCLQDHFLLLTLRVPRHGVASPADFTQQILTALGAQYLELPPSPQPLSDTASVQLHKQPWTLLHPNRRNAIHKFTPHPTINANNFGIDEFRRLNKKVPNPQPTDGTPKPLIFICARYGNVSGPIDTARFAHQDLPSSGLFLSHPCFGVRVLHGLPYAGPGYPPDAECYEDVCPGEDREMRAITPPPNLEVSLVRQRSSPETPTDRRVRQRQFGSLLNSQSSSTVPSMFFAALPTPTGHTSSALPNVQLTPLPLPPPPPPPPQFPVLCRADVSPLRRGYNLAHPQDVYMWQIGLSSEVIRHPSLARFQMHAATIDAAARGLWSLLLHFEHRENIEEPFILPPDILAFEGMQSKASFFRDIRMLRIGLRLHADGSSGAISTGTGPERAVYHLAIPTAIQNSEFWVEAGSSGYYIPVLSMASVAIPDRCQTFSAFGSLLALHAYTLGQGPFPGMVIPKDVLAALDPVAFDILAPWLSMSPSDLMPTNIVHPLCQFLLNVMDMQAFHISAPRTQQVHNGWTITFMSKVLLGTSTPWDHPEFIALKDGFDIEVGDTSVLKIRKVEDIVDRLVFEIIHSSPDGTTPYFAALFRLLLRRYLVGIGHPPKLRGAVIGDEDWSAQVNNELLRVSLLLEAATDTDLRPTSQSWSITFHISATRINMNTDDMEAEPRPLHFHTCMHEVDIRLTRAMEDLLVRSSKDLDSGTYSSDFDTWIHCQLLARDHNTMVHINSLEELQNLMPDPPPRRNPARSTRVPRHADSPVSFSLSRGNDSSGDDESDRSETELSRDLSTGFDQAAQRQTVNNYFVMHGDVMEIRDSPSPELRSVPRQHTDNGDARPDSQEPDSDESGPEGAPGMDDVDSHGGTLQERANHLINEVIELRGLTCWPSKAPSEDPAPVMPTTPPPPRQVSVTYTTLQGGQRCLYFVGIQTLTASRTFCQIREFADTSAHNGAIFLRLQNAGGPVGRALAAIVDRSAYFVGTSDFPVEIAGNYASHQQNFREINSLLELENSYHERHFLSWLSASLRILLYMFFMSIISGYRPTVAAVAANAGPTLISAFLLERFASQYEDLHVWRNRDYGTAYNHCLTERQILSICQALNIGLLGRTHTPAIIGDMTIRLEDVVSAAGINFQSFSTMRTEFRMVKEAHVLLRQRNRSEALMPVYTPLLNFLDSMLGERVLEPGLTYVAGAMGLSEVEFSVVRCQITTLMAEIRGVLDTLGRA